MTLSLVLLSGFVVAGGLVCLVLAFAPSVPRLDAAMARVGGGGVSVERIREVGPVSSRSERLGALLYRLSPVTPSQKQRQALRLQDKSIAEFYADKAVMAIIGIVLPAVLLLALAVLGVQVGALPALVPLVGAVVGYLLPNLLLARHATVVRTGAVEALLVFIDLVTLERLTNASATQALHNAAALSEVPLFVQIRTALDRARLEQQSPYAELRRLAEQLSLPQLADVADVMQLDESGAALSGTLRARVQELRDAHMTSEQIKASASAEGMTLYMSLPTLIFAMILLAAAMLQIVYS